MASIKKKVNVPTPIDERETFVSLRKNFAENEQLVQEKLKTLYELQNTQHLGRIFRRGLKLEST